MYIKTFENQKSSKQIKELEELLKKAADQVTLLQKIGISTARPVRKELQI